MNLYTLTSDLHGEFSMPAKDEAFIQELENALGNKFTYKENDYSDYGNGEDIIYVRTGGTEGIFKSIFCKDGEISVPGGRKIKLLTSGKSNSLAASMEILSFLCQKNYPGEIIHGTSGQMAEALGSDAKGEFCSQRRPLSPCGVLEGKRYGVIGKPSDWLISSDVDYAKAKRVLGVELIDIPMEEMLEEYLTGKMEDMPSLNEPNAPRYGKPITSDDYKKSFLVYSALKRLVRKYSLDGLTLRCFDLLGTIGSTGCMGLAILNSEGIIATCEGDVPTMLSMGVAKALTSMASFQVNLSKAFEDKLLFAHCTVPLNIVKSYVYDTHFESGIGVAVHGEFEPGKATIIKIGSDLEHYITRDITLEGNQYENNLCRTQVIIKAEGLKDYMLNEPLGNHHVLIPGSHAEAIIAALSK